MEKQTNEITMRKHEIEEIRLMGLGLSQDEAHTEASKLYNYTKESDDFYKKLGLKSKKKDARRISRRINQST